MRICFTSDFHGSESLYQQLDELLRRERPELVILGGDMFPDGDPDDPTGTQGRYVQEAFIQRIEAWRDALPTTAFACILGNHDWRCTQHALHTYHEQGVLTLLDHRWIWAFRGVSFLGYPCTPPTPYFVKDFERLDRPGDALPETGGSTWDTRHLRVQKVSPHEHYAVRPTMEEELRKAVRPYGAWIFVCHCPPIASVLDRLPHLDFPVGSNAVRDFVAQRKPLLALHGHIHESPQVTGAYRDSIDGVLSINPGQVPDRLHAVLLDTDRPAETLRHTVYA
ncbi:MAG: metallophosphoesterase [Planctomycetes bacterium]|nr:metallophosphoesterase [Planctomycetota bacterium]